MYKIRIEESFDSAHFLAGYDGKCSNLHGHRWRIVMEQKQINYMKKDSCGEWLRILVTFAEI